MNKSEFVSKFVIDNADKIEGSKLLKAAEDAWKAYRKDNGIIRGESAIGTLSALCAAGKVSDREFNEWLENAGKTAQGLKGHYRQVMLMANEIHSFYMEEVEETEE